MRRLTRRIKEERNEKEKYNFYVKKYNNKENDDCEIKSKSN